MSMTTEWILAIHRAVWFPVLYAMGLEGRSVELMDRQFRYTGAALPKPVRARTSGRRAVRRKAA
jgi:hypothetical protein